MLISVKFGILVKLVKPYDYSLDGQPLTKVDDEKDLGVIISKGLKVFQRCASAYSKVNEVLSVINRSLSAKLVNVMLRLYNSAVRPHVEFRTAAWSPYY